MILSIIVQGLISLSNNLDVLRNLLDAITTLFELDTENPAPESVIAPVIARFLEQDGLTKLLEIQKHPNMDIYLMVDRIGTKIDEFEKGLEDCQLVEIGNIASEN